MPLVRDPNLERPLQTSFVGWHRKHAGRLRRSCLFFQFMEIRSTDTSLGTQFVRAFLRHWGAKVTGAFMIPAVIASASAFEPYWKVIWWGMAALASILTAFNLWAQERRKVLAFEERDRPKLEVECNEGISGCHTGRDGSHEFFRIAVTLRWTQPAVGCFGKLMKIERGGVVVRDHDVEQLPYARSHEPDALNKTLIPDAREFLDVLVVGKKYQPNRVFGPSIHNKEYVLTDASGNDVFLQPGDYTLTVALFGQIIPTQPHRFLFRWTGDAQSSRLQFIE